MMTAHTPGASTHHSADSAALHGALGDERKLLDDLLRALERQRGAVADNDIDSIEKGVADVHRILLTLGEALTRRRRVVALVTGSEETPLSELAPYLKESREAVDTMVKDISAVARTVARELVTTRALLQTAIAEGDAYLQTLAGSELEGSVYQRSEGDSGRRHSVLINEHI